LSLKPGEREDVQPRLVEPGKDLPDTPGSAAGGIRFQ